MTWRDAEFLTFRLKVTAPRRAGEDGRERAGRRQRRSGPPRLAPLPVRRQSEARWRRRSTTGTGWSLATRSAGPALIDDKTTTVLVLPGFTCEVDAYRNLVLRVQ